MRTSFRAAFLFAAAALVALQVAQPVSGHLVDREVFEVASPTYDLERRQAATPIPSPTTNQAPPSATPGTGCRSNDDCFNGTCDNGKCVPKVGTGIIGFYCTGDNQCQKDAYCYRGSCQTIKPDGHVCYKDSGCSSGQCVNKKCIALKSLPNNAGCTNSNQCKNGSFCDNRKCNDVQPVNAKCYKDQGCTSGHCVRGKCSGRGLAKDYQSCDRNSGCLSNFCFKNACRPRRERGRACSLNDACLSNRCRKNRTCA